MAFPNYKLADDEYTEILDEEFQRHVAVAKSLIKTLKRQKDKDICVKFIVKCASLDSPSIEVKTNRNEFFKYFLKILQTTATTQPLEYDDWFKPKVEKKRDDKETKFWSKDKRTYVCAKQIEGHATMVYMAVAYKPEFGWQSSGFSTYEF